jgi:hypothetical protein
MMRTVWLGRGLLLPSLHLHGQCPAQARCRVQCCADVHAMKLVEKEYAELELNSIQVDLFLPSEIIPGFSFPLFVVAIVLSAFLTLTSSQCTRFVLQVGKVRVRQHVNPFKAALTVCIESSRLIALHITF